MIVFKKNGGTKIVSESNQAFIDLIKADGWVEFKEEIKEKEPKNGKSSKSSN